ncbi:MAG TPA: right-handed parallel beta-helix repeat-containing protein [Terriglobia bacterium]|nr:right-handed parallel beta-helix repeat-containing protein [Terriglobia bacterium]
MKNIQEHLGILLFSFLMFGSCCLAAKSAPAAGGRHLYVSMMGSDSNPGTKEKPFSTLQHAAAVAKPGDTVDVRGGTYCQRLTITTSGSAAGGDITLRSEPGEKAILDGGCLFPKNGSSGMISLHNVSYVTIQGFEVRNYKTNNPRSAPFGIRFDGHGSHIRILDNDVHSIQQLYQGFNKIGSGANGFGIAVYGTDAAAPISDLTIEGNQVHDLHTGSSESLVLNGNVTHFRVARNRVYENDNIGIDIIGYEPTVKDLKVDRARDGVVEENLVYDISSEGNPAYGLSPSRRGDASSDGIYVDGGTRVVIQRNIIHGADFGIEMASEHLGRNTSYIIARNNLIYFCHNAGISIGGYDERRGGSNHVTIVNNTLYMNNAWRVGTGEFFMQMHMQNNIFENNIVYIGAPASATHSRSGPVNPNTPTVTMDHNLFYYAGGPDVVEWSYNDKAYASFKAFLKATGGSRQIFADPQFVDVYKEDFHLRSGSPAIGRGANLGEAVTGARDLDGRPRTKDGKIDMGCYQDM